jgi:type IV secretory pathway TraG/TraD family ATPase VirD4
MADLIKNRTTVYLVIPTDRIDTQKTWLRLVLAAGMHTFKRFPMRQRPGHRCLFLIDEFGSLGRLDNLPGDLAYMSNYGLDLTLIVQGLDQLKTHYGDARDTILNNCDYKWFCNIGDLNTAKWLSESLGRRTVRTRSTSKSESHGDRSSSTGDSVSEGEMGRLLFEPNELLTLQKDVAIAMNPKGKPYLLRPVDYWNLEGAFGTLRRQHSGLFWKPPMKFDPNPCHMEQPEEGDVFVS